MFHCKAKSKSSIESSGTRIEQNRILCFSLFFKPLRSTTYHRCRRGKRESEDIVNHFKPQSKVHCLCKLPCLPKQFDDIVLQCEVIDECTLDPHSGLNLPAHPASAHVLLARPSALAMAGLADVLDFMPWGHPFRHRAAGMWQRMAAGLSQCLPRKQAAWGVMPDRPAGTDNPLSLTGTSAAVYAVAKGVRLGYLGKKEGKMAVQAFAALTQQWEEGKKEADSAAWYVLAAVELHRMQQEE